MSYKGKFIPKNIKKYMGNAHNITYRSLWEKQYMAMLDANPNIARWSSEEVIIPYYSRLEGKKRRYYMDFWFKDIEGKEYLIEIKPFAQTQPPQPPKRLTEAAKKRFAYESYTYNVNKDKWLAAYAYAEKKNMKFKVLTEKTLPMFGIKC